MEEKKKKRNLLLSLAVTFKGSILTMYYCLLFGEKEKLFTPHLNNINFNILTLLPNFLFLFSKATTFHKIDPDCYKLFTSNFIIERCYQQLLHSAKSEYISYFIYSQDDRLPVKTKLIVSVIFMGHLCFYTYIISNNFTRLFVK